MTIVQPDIKDIYSYIIQTHRADHIPVTMDHINIALGKINHQKGMPALEGLEKVACIGHFKAINFAIKLAGSIDFPAKDPAILTHEYASHNCLYWLRELHSTMMYPIAEFGLKNGTGQLYIQSSQCGTYRYSPKQLAFSPAPDPDLIPKLLHLWLKDVTEFDAEIKDKVDNPYGLTPAQSNKKLAITKECSLFFSCLQPFEDGNNRIAKLVENTLRLRWRMPWRTIHDLEAQTYYRDLSNYQSDSNGFLRWLRR